MIEKKLVFEENINLPEISLLNFGDKNVFLKNKLEYSKEDNNTNKDNLNLSYLRNSERFELKYLLPNHNPSPNNSATSGYKKINIIKNQNSFRKFNSKDFSKRSKIYEKYTKESENELNEKKSYIIDEKNYSNQKNYSVVNNSINKSQSTVKNRIDRNYFKKISLIILGSLMEVQNEYLGDKEKKINDYVFEFNKQFEDFSLKKKKTMFTDINNNKIYMKNLQSLKSEILKNKF